MSPLHRSILEFIRTVPSDEGVEQKAIVEAMTKKGEDRYKITDTFRELVSGGILNSRDSYDIRLSNHLFKLPTSSSEIGASVDV